MNKLSNLPPGVTDRMIEEQSGGNEIERRRLEAFEEIFRTEPVTIPISGAVATDLDRLVKILDQGADRYMTWVSLQCSIVYENLPLDGRAKEFATVHKNWRRDFLEIHADKVNGFEGVGDRL